MSSLQKNLTDYVLVTAQPSVYSGSAILSAGVLVGQDQATCGFSRCYWIAVHSVFGSQPSCYTGCGSKGMVTSCVSSATSTVSCSLTDLSFINLSAELECLCPCPLSHCEYLLFCRLYFPVFTFFFLVEEASFVKQITIY